MFSVELPGGLKISADTLEEADLATIHFSRLIGGKEMAFISGVSERTLQRWPNCPSPPVRLCDFLAYLGEPRGEKGTISDNPRRLLDRTPKQP